MRLYRLIGCLALLSSLCQAQDVGPEKVIARAYNLDAREAFRQLFKSVGLPYSIDPTIAGSITINQQGDTFERALQTILRQVKSTYRCSGGIYQIIPLDVPDKTDVGSYNPPQIEIKDADCRQALIEIFKTYGFKAIIQPKVSGLLTYSGIPSSFDQLLRTISAKAGFDIQRLPGKFEILKAPSEAPVFALISDLPYSKPQSIVDEDYRYEVKRDRLVKVDRLTQRVVLSCPLQRTFPYMNLNLSLAKDRLLLEQAAGLADAKLAIAPEMQSKVSIGAGPATVDHIKKGLARSLGISLTEHEGVQLLLRSVNMSVDLNLFDFDPIAENTYRSSSITRIGTMFQVDSGRWRYLLRQDDLSIVKWESRPTP